MASKPFFSPTTLHGGGRQFSHGCSGHGQFGHSTSNYFNGNQSFCIPHKSNKGPRGVYSDYNGPCPVHPTLTHTWDNCFNNPKTNFKGSQNVRNQERGGQTRRGLYYSNQRGWGSGRG